VSFKSSARTLSRLALIPLLALSLSGCQTVKGWFGKDEPETETLPVEALYQEARDSRDGGNYSRAETYYTRLIGRFPFGPYTEQSQLDLAYAQYKQGKHEDATSTLDRFIRTYPTHPAIDYAYYLRALNGFDRDSFFLQRVARADMSSRDLSKVQASFESFAELLRRYPASRYAGDSRQRMVYLRNFLARHEINTGLYYYRREAFVSSINRAKYLLETYPQSEFEADAVALLAASYTELGQDTLAADSTRVLEMNYPQHPYLQGDWPKGNNLWGQLNPFGGGR
jgi:outer membrane protein assembly factor BamD